MGLYHCAKFGYDRCSSFYNMNILVLTRLAGKCLFTPQKLGFWGNFIPKMGCNINESPQVSLNGSNDADSRKDVSLRESASFEPLSVKMW